MSTITKRLGIEGETRQLKLGRSFQTHRSHRDPNPSEGLHTIRYDFKPASIDTTKMADIEFGENNKVTVTMPNVDSAGLSQTVFKGSRKPHLKECVLIIDNETGELTLERLTHNMAVKKTRAEGGSRGGLPRPVTPSFENNPNDVKANNGNNTNLSSSSIPHNNQRKLSPPSISGSYSNGRPSSPNVKSNSLSVSANQFSLSQGVSPSSLSSKSNRSSPNLLSYGLHRSPLVHTTPQASSSSSQPSMPRNDNLGLPNLSKPDDDMIGILSESSSDSSDHGSSSSDGSDSSSDEDDEIKQTVKEGFKSLKDEASSKSSSSGSDSSSESDDDEPKPSPPSSSSLNNPRSRPNVTNGSSSSSANPVLPSMPNMLSMPKFSQLSEDLQLSESGSDSD